MSRENIEILRECFAIFNRSGLGAVADAFGDLLAPEFRMEEAFEVPDRDTYVGKNAFLNNLSKLEESFEELRMEPTEFVDLGDQIVVVVSMSGRGRGGGAPVRGSFAQLWSLRDGRAVALRDYATKVEALEAVGRSG